MVQPLVALERGGGGLWKLWLPKEAVKVPMSHVLKDHGQGLSIGAHAIETYNVFVLKYCQQFGLTLEVLSCRLIGILQSLMKRIIIKKNSDHEIFF